MQLRRPPKHHRGAPMTQRDEGEDDMKKSGNPYLVMFRYISCALVFLIGIMGILGSNEEIENDGGGESLQVVGASKNMVGLDGRWDGACETGVEEAASAIYVLNISGTAFSMMRKGWISSDDCSGQYDFSYETKGNLIVGEASEAIFKTASTTANRVEIAYTSARLTSYNQEFVDALNQDQSCGVDDWVVNGPKEVLDTKCGPKSQVKSLIYIDDNSHPLILYMGIGKGTVDANSFPAEIDADIAFERS